MNQALLHWQRPLFLAMFDALHPLMISGHFVQKQEDALHTEITSGLAHGDYFCHVDASTAIEKALMAKGCVVTGDAGETFYHSSEADSGLRVKPSLTEPHTRAWAWYFPNKQV